MAGGVAVVGVYMAETPAPFHEAALVPVRRKDGTDQREFA